jgi:hypothetical protein
METLKVEKHDHHIQAYLLQDKAIKADMLQLLEVVRETFSDQKPVTLVFPNIGFEFFFDTEASIKNFEKTITVLVPYIANRIVVQLEMAIEKEKNFELVSA